MGRFDGLKADLAEEKAPKKRTPKAEVPATSRANRGEAAPSYMKPSRKGKRGILGYFSLEMCKELRIIAAQEDTTVQALMGEAFDLLMRAKGKHPFGER